MPHVPHTVRPGPRRAGGHKGAAAYAGLCLLVIGACRAGDAVDAPRPEVLDDDDALPEELPLSSLNVPIDYDLSPVLASLERAVPRTFGDIEERLSIPGNDRVQVAFEAERSPFNAALEGEIARISATIRYRGRGWYNPPLAPEVSASCGTSDERDDRPRAVVGMSASIDLTSDWTLAARSRLDRIGPATEDQRDQCRVTVLRIDVTERVIDAAGSLLRGNTSLVDDAIAGIDLRSRFEELWDILQRPLELTDSVWLIINPVAVRKGRATGEGTMLHASLGLRAAPRILVGPRPAMVPVPLPPLETDSVEDGLHILMEGQVDYDVASGLLTRELGGRSIERAGRHLRIRRVDLYGIGAGRLALEVAFDGSARGTIFFVGTPHYDEDTGEAFVPDLDFDVATSDRLVSGLAWIGSWGGLVEFLRERARVPVADAIREGERLLHEGLNRSLSPTVHISGEVLSVRPLGVHATRDALIVRAHAEARARMEIRREEATAAAVRH